MNRYILDKKEQHAIIETDEPKCKLCKKEFKEDDEARFETGEKGIRCNECATTKGLSTDYKYNPYGFYPGRIKIVRCNEKWM